MPKKLPKSWPVGMKIKCIRPMTDAELKREGWSTGRHEVPMAIELEDGSVIYPSQDQEGNGPGAIFYFANGQTGAWHGQYKTEMPDIPALREGGK